MQSSKKDVRVVLDGSCALFGTLLGDDDPLSILQVNLQWDHCWDVFMHWKFKQPPASFSGTDVSGSLMRPHVISWLIILESVDGHVTTFVDIL